MTLCDLFARWDELGPSSGRFEELAEFLNDVLEGWGFDAVTIIQGIPPDDPFLGGPPCAAYDSPTETIILNPDCYITMGADDGIMIGIHEVLHVAADQAGLDFEDIEEELVVGLLSGELYLEEIAECTSSEAPESGAAGNILRYPWQSGHGG